MPRVSVIVPSYNHERFVRRAVESALAQTFADLEVVVVDDGSKDGTADAVRAVADPRVRLAVLPENRGASAAANECLRLARGEMVAMLSSDDAFLPEKIARQVAWLDAHPEIGAVFGRIRLVDERGAPCDGARTVFARVFDFENRGRREWLRRFFFEGNCLCHPTSLIRRACYEAAGGFDERLMQLPDLDLWIRLCLRYEIHVMDEVVTEFRVMDGEANVSGLRPAVLKRCEVELVEVLERFTAIPSLEELRRVFPEVEAPASAADPRLVPFLVARLALRHPRPAHHAFAVRKMYAVLGDPELRALVERELGFRPPDLFRAVSASDPLRFDALQAARAEARAVKRSSSYKLARALTWPFRWLEPGPGPGPTGSGP